jgi:hypothetical protein
MYGYHVQEWLGNCVVEMDDGTWRNPTAGSPETIEILMKYMRAFEHELCGIRYDYLCHAFRSHAELLQALHWDYPGSIEVFCEDGQWRDVLPDVEHNGLNAMDVYRIKPDWRLPGTEPEGEWWWSPLVAGERFGENVPAVRIPGDAKSGRPRFTYASDAVSAETVGWQFWAFVFGGKGPAASEAGPWGVTPLDMDCHDWWTRKREGEPLEVAKWAVWRRK